MKVISRNKKASFNYELLDEYQAGISLLGSEIKSVRLGKVSMDGSYVSIDSKGAWLKQVNIEKYEFSQDNHDPLRNRQLLLKKSELKKLRRSLEEKGFSIVPTAIGISKRGHAKVDIAVAKGKTKADKRETIKAREFDRKKKELLG